MVEIGIVGTGSYLPNNVLTNSDIAEKVAVTDDWIMDKSGIKERRIANVDEFTSDLASIASIRALQSASIDPKIVDLIIVATATGDQLSPATACRVQASLGASNAIPMDLSAGCSGFVYGIRVARDMLRASSEMRYALVIGAELLSRFVDYEDERTCILFGDGAGAAVLSRVDSGGIRSCVLGADGTAVDLAGIPAGGSRMPPSQTTLMNRSHYIQMDGRKVRDYVSGMIGDVVSRLLIAEGISASNLSLVVPHQANGQMINEWTKILDLENEQVYRNVEDVGNTSSASIPIALDQAVRECRVRPGDLVLMIAFGGGVTWGACLVHWCSYGNC